MIYGQPNSLLRRVTHIMRDLSGLLATGATPTGGEIQISANGVALVNAAGTDHEVGSGAYYYGATSTDASVYGSLILLINKSGYVPQVIEEPITDTGFSYIALNESLDARARIFFVIEDVSGVFTPGLTISGAQVKIGYNDGALSVALGTVVPVGSGIYYYQTTEADRALEGDIVLVISVDPLLYKDVVARKLVLRAGSFVVPPPQVNLGIPPADLTNLAGWDISLRGGDFTTTPAGDWEILGGVDCTEQSVVRELLANRNSFPRRPEWGSDLPSLLLKGQTKAVQDKVVSFARGAMLKNPRLRRVNTVRADRIQGKPGLALSMDADAVDGPLKTKIPITPVRNQ